MTIRRKAVKVTRKKAQEAQVALQGWEVSILATCREQPASGEQLLSAAGYISGLETSRGGWRSLSH